MRKPEIKPRTTSKKEEPQQLSIESMEQATESTETKKRIIKDKVPIRTRMQPPPTTKEKDKEISVVIGRNNIAAFSEERHRICTSEDRHSKVYNESDLGTISSRCFNTPLEQRALSLFGASKHEHWRPTEFTG